MSSPEAPPPSEPTLEDLQYRVAELTEAVAARDAFIAIAAHELRNPMTPIIGQVELLLSGIRTGKYTPAQIEQRLGHIRQAMSHYVKRASVLLNVSRITTGKLSLAPTPFDLSDLVREVVATFAEPAQHAGCPIGIDAPASLPGTWDRLAMEQILDNLISNAIKYGAHQPVEVRIEALDDKAQIRVRDHGPGISPDDRLRVFDRFERVVRMNEHRSGFGVGLWVVSQLVEAMAGTISLENGEGGGSVFTATVPRHT